MEHCVDISAAVHTDSMAKMCWSAANTVLVFSLHRLPADSADQGAGINRAGSHADLGRQKLRIAEAATSTGMHT